MDQRECRDGGARGDVEHDGGTPLAKSVSNPAGGQHQQHCAEPAEGKSQPDNCNAEMRITDPEKNRDCLEQSVAQGIDGRHRKERTAKAGEPGRRGQRAVGHADPADDTSASRRAATSVGVTQSKSPLTPISTPASDESKSESSRRLSESMPASYKLSSQLKVGSSTTSWQRRRITSLRFTSVSRAVTAKLAKHTMAMATPRSPSPAPSSAHPGPVASRDERTCSRSRWPRRRCRRCRPP